jgi:CheY-like chemotaxis protein
MTDVMTGPLVLLVEDNALMAIDFEAALTQAGFQVVHAATSAAALDLLDQRIDLFQAVVTDIQLGGVADGWAVARHARTLVSAMPVVYMTGDSAEAWAVSGVPDSILLQKPFSEVQLTSALAALLNIRHVSAGEAKT